MIKRNILGLFTILLTLAAQGVALGADETFRTFIFPNESYLTVSPEKAAVVRGFFSKGEGKKKTAVVLDAFRGRRFQYIEVTPPVAPDVLDEQYESTYVVQQGGEQESYSSTIYKSARRELAFLYTDDTLYVFNENDINPSAVKIPDKLNHDFIKVNGVKEHPRFTVLKPINLNGFRAWPLHFYIEKDTEHVYRLFITADGKTFQGGAYSLIQKKYIIPGYDELVEEQEVFKMIAQKMQNKSLVGADLPKSFQRQTIGETHVASGSGNGKDAVEDVVNQYFRIDQSEVSFDGFSKSDVDAVARVLNKFEAKNAFIIGESGSGKSELLRHIVSETRKGHIKGLSSDTEFRVIDALSVGAGTKHVGVFEARIKALVEYCKGRNVILVMDEVHSLRGQGTHSENSNDIFDSLKPYMADGSLQILAATTKDEYRIYFSGDPAIVRRSQVIEVKPMPMSRVDSALVSWSKYYGLEPLAPKIRKRLLALVERFSSVGLPLPNATKLQDEFYAYLRVEGIDPKSATAKQLDQVAQNTYRAPDYLFDEIKKQKKVEQVEHDLLDAFEATPYLGEALDHDFKTMVYENNDPTAPLGLRFLVGPKGVGKTRSLQKFAEITGLPLTEINLSRYVGQSADAFISEVVDAIEKNPHAIILIDEVDKAREAPYLQDALLNLLTNSSIMVKKSKSGKSSSDYTFVRVQINKALIYLGGNAGEGALMNGGAGSELVAAIRAEGISDKLIDRLDVTPVYPPATEEQYKQGLRKILALRVKDIEKYKGIQIGIPNQEVFLDQMVSLYFNEKPVSYREAKKTINTAVSRALNNYSKNAKGAKGNCILTLEQVAFQPSIKPKKISIGFIQ